MPLVHISLRRGKSSHYLRQIADGVHRALVDAFEVPPDEEKELEAMAKREMEQVVKLKVPLQVSGAFGRNWNECKG